MVSLIFRDFDGYHEYEDGEGGGNDDDDDCDGGGCLGAGASAG